MGVYEWALLGVMYAVIVAVFLPVYLTERHKVKKLNEKITDEILRAKRRKWIRIFGLGMGALVLIGGSLTTILCSIYIETPPKGIYAVIMALMAFTVLVCLSLEVLSFSHFTAASEEGVWASRLFAKPKFIAYENVYSIWYCAREYVVCGKGRKKEFTLSERLDDGTAELLELLQKRAPRLKRWCDEEIFPL